MELEAKADELLDRCDEDLSFYEAAMLVLEIEKVNLLEDMKYSTREQDLLVSMRHELIKINEKIQYNDD